MPGRGFACPERPDPCARALELGDRLLVERGGATDSGTRSLTGS